MYYAWSSLIHFHMPRQWSSTCQIIKEWASLEYILWC